MVLRSRYYLTYRGTEVVGTGILGPRDAKIPAPQGGRVRRVAYLNDCFDEERGKERRRVVGLERSSISTVIERFL